MNLLNIPRLLAIAFIALLLTSCAHHHKAPKHHHHVYNKQCAYSVAHGKLGVSGSEEFKLLHHGETYYFSSQKKKDDFQLNLEKSIEIANRYWLERSTLIDRK